jgi:arginyl-tRNA synthetase
MLRLQTKEGPQKMSKRAGTVVDLEWLISQVGSDVVRFLMISSDIKSQMVFDLELAKEKSEKNPVFYVQYALVRCCSVLRNAQKIINKNNQEALELLKEKEELSLIKQIVKFPDLILGIAENHEVHHLITYATSLAKKTHQFYNNCHIIDEKELKTTQSRLFLVETAKSVLERLFEVIGIEKTEKM